MRGLKQAHSQAATFYHECLLSDPAATAARSYLRSRRYDSKTVKCYQLGWATDTNPISSEMGHVEGLTMRDERGEPLDRFRNRIMFPIWDLRGDVIGFGGRILPDADGPKYINSPTTPIYPKSRTLYGFNFAAPHILEADKVIVVEGYTDVIALGRADIGYSVATCGTGLSREHIDRLRRFTDNIYLLYDGDKAGRNASQRHNLPVIELPDGSDPGSLSSEELRGAVLGHTEQPPESGVDALEVGSSRVVSSDDGQHEGVGTDNSV